MAYLLPRPHPPYERPFLLQLGTKILIQALSESGTLNKIEIRLINIDFKCTHIAACGTIEETLSDLYRRNRLVIPDLIEALHMTRPKIEALNLLDQRLHPLPNASASNHLVRDSFMPHITPFSPPSASTPTPPTLDTLILPVFKYNHLQQLSLKEPLTYLQKTLLTHLKSPIHTHYNSNTDNHLAQQTVTNYFDQLEQNDL